MRCGRRTVAFACLILGCLLPVDSRGSQALLRDVKVVLPSSAEVLDGQSLLVREGRIERMAATAELRAPADVPVIEGGGAYLLPGFIDTHVHYRPHVPFLGHLAHGVTTVLGLGQDVDDLPALREIRAEIAAGRRAGPRIYTTGATIAHHVRPETPGEARAYVRSLAEDGYDFVKIYNEISREVFDAVVDEARRQGLSVFGHVPRNFPVEASITGGIDVVTHAEEFYFTWFDGPRDQELESLRGGDRPEPGRAEALVRLMVDHGVTFIPNLTFTFQQMKLFDDEDAVLATPEAAHLHPSIARSWASRHSGRRPRWAKRMLRERIKYGVIHDLTWRAHEHGLLITTGTDAPLPGLFPGLSLHSEMRELVKAGLTPAEALAAATVNGGELIRRLVDADARVGRVEEGYEADLVLVEGDPLEDLRHAERIVGVMSDGVWHAQSELDGRRARLAARYARLEELGHRVEELVDEGAAPAEIRTLLSEHGDDGADFVEEILQSRSYRAYAEGRREDLLRSARQHAQIFPESVEAWIILGEVRALGDDVDGAREAFERALELDPDSQEARRLLEELEESP